ncbi:MAG: hypothetical protein HFE78_05100 [Clostridiales bacterium]|nr:hypothetical protein [Clostridiales bacterium]
MIGTRKPRRSVSNAGEQQGKQIKHKSFLLPIIHGLILYQFGGYHANAFPRKK